MPTFNRPTMFFLGFDEIAKKRRYITENFTELARVPTDSYWNMNPELRLNIDSGELMVVIGKVTREQNITLDNSDFVLRMMYLIFIDPTALVMHFQQHQYLFNNFMANTLAKIKSVDERGIVTDLFCKEITGHGLNKAVDFCKYLKELEEKHLESIKNKYRY